MICFQDNECECTGKGKEGVRSSFSKSSFCVLCFWLYVVRQERARLRPLLFFFNFFCCSLYPSPWLFMASVWLFLTSVWPEASGNMDADQYSSGGGGGSHKRFKSTSSSHTTHRICLLNQRHSLFPHLPLAHVIISPVELSFTGYLTFFKIL